MHHTARTAITRTKPSAPLRYLVANGHVDVEKRMLDFGCGKGTDAKFYNMDKYDPAFFPSYPEGKYDIVLCTYVLNVIPTEGARHSIVRQIRGLLAEGGVAYITVRNDVNNLNGWTERGTWQGWVDVPGGELIHEERSFRIYQLENTDAEEES